MTNPTADRDPLKLAAKISIVGWGLSLLLNFINIAVNGYHAQSSLSPSNIWFLTGFKGTCMAISFMLLKQPERKLLFFMAALCLFALWKFYVGSIFAYMLPALGGLTFREAVVDWWHRSTANAVGLISLAVFGPFVLASLFFWANCALTWRDESRSAKPKSVE